MSRVLSGVIVRYGVSIVTAAAVTFAVLFTMLTLIATANKDLDESGKRHFVDFVRVERAESSQRKARKVKKPAAPKAMPQMAQPQTADISDAPSATAIDIGPVAVEMDVDVSSIGIGVSDGEYLPIVKIAPVYPMRALNRGLEGYVIVEFTVTAAGTVRDVVVVDAKPEGIFDKASVAAALKFKYKPRIVNGEPITVEGVRNIFRYNLED